MAENKSTFERMGVTRGKAALIAVLAVALLGVIYLQYGGSQAGLGDRYDDDAPRVARAARPSPRAVGQPSPPEPQEELAVEASLAAWDQSRWRPPKLTEVIAYDPFALPAAFPRPPLVDLDSTSASEQADLSAARSADQLAQAVERLRQQLEELQRRGVQVIVSGQDQFVAMVDGRTVHIGDEIEGFTVTAIDPNGVRVERKDVE